MVSKVYDKSVSSKYKQYFEQQSEINKSFRQFSLRNNKIVPKNASDIHPWESGQAGVPISWVQSEGNVIVDHTDSHTLVIGPTGSKKSRLIAMPLVRILGSQKEDMIIADPKAELFNRTASYLSEQGYKIFVLNLRSPLHGNCWNPLAIPYSFFCDGEIDRAYEFVNDIAENLIQADKSNNDPFWDNSAGALFFGLAILLFKYCKEYNKGAEYVHIANIIGLRNALFSAPEGAKTSRLWKYAKTDPIITSALIGTVETANDTRGGILSVFDQKVRIFSIQPNLLDMLSTSDIDLNMIGQGSTVVFLILPDEKTGYHSLVSLFIKQSYEYIIFKAQQEKEDNGFQIGKLKNRVNYLLDEFSSLPTIRDFPAMITASRSRNIRFTLIIQSKHQLLQRYKDETETIQTNCNNWIFLTSRELQLLEEISSLCGKVNADNSKPILSVAALQRLDKEKGEALLLLGRAKPFMTFLPDIDVYDGGKYKEFPMEARKSKELSVTDFEIPLSEEEKRQAEQKQAEMKSFLGMQEKKRAEMEKLSALPNINFDSLITRLNKQIAKLEEETLVEEKGSKQDDNNI